ncbi:MAG: phosphopentomutase [Clostridia bacterium]|jgi:phosphopentomutase|nr:phosphopentomutase [Clostridia bacterium]
MKRAIIIVLDSVGIGELPDAYKYHDEGSNTLVNLKKAKPEMELKNLCAIGLGNIQGKDIDLLGKVNNPTGAYGKMAEASNGKDTTTGHWEMAGIITETPFPTFTEHGFPYEVMRKLEEVNGDMGFLGNYAASGTEIINVLGEEHMKTGYPIVYTSADSVMQIAAHEDIVPVKKLYGICENARKIMTGKYAVGRIIARPFIGDKNGNFTRTKNRRDFSLPPTSTTILDVISSNGLDVKAIGKIEDIFLKRGITFSNHTTNNPDGIEKTIEFIKDSSSGLIFTNLVDTDMLYGHRNDTEGYKNALMYFDNKLPEIESALKDGDILFMTADHGCDPTTPSTDHSREYVPILAYGKNVKENVDLGIRSTFADLGKTILDYLGLENTLPGTSFLKDILK